MNMEPSKVVDCPDRHPLFEVPGLSESFVSRLREQWVSTVEEAVAWFAAEGGEDAERDVFLDKARQILGEERFAALQMPAPAKTFGCELPEETKEVQP